MAEPQIGDKANVSDREPGSEWVVESLNPVTGAGVLVHYSPVYITFYPDDRNGGYVAYNGARVTFNKEEDP